MPLKKRNKPNAEFSMSSLTDIIFLLLIFFMLTSTLVKPPVFDLPESSSKTVAPQDIVVGLDMEGKYFVNGEEVRSSQIYSKVRADLSKMDNRQNATMSISADANVPFDRVMKIMTIAERLKMKAIIATQPAE